MSPSKLIKRDSSTTESEILNSKINTEQMNTIINSGLINIKAVKFSRLNIIEDEEETSLGNLHSPSKIFYIDIDVNSV